ncbi:sensor histidine kinase [Spirillospora sp. CA-253888]
MSALPVMSPFRRWAGTPWPDAALALLAMAAQTWPLLTLENPAGVPWHWWGYASAAGSAVPIVWRRRAPLAALVACVTMGSLYDLVEPVARQPLWYGALIALYTVASRSGRTVRLLAFAVPTVGGLLTVGSSDTALRGVLLSVTAYAFGRAAAGARAHAAALEERAERLERDRLLEAERAAERERARIAHDMHDILAHAVSLMVVQAEAGPVAARADPARAEEVFDTIAAAGRDAMDQLRRLLEVLKQEQGPRDPQPTIDDLPELADRVAGAGLEVAYAVVGEPRPLPPDGGVAAYRITQEALTNVVKHAGAGRAEVRLAWHEEDLVIDIVDDGRGAGAAPATGLPAGGNGLIGIRERAAACGGAATAGPREDGPGFRVSVRLPLGAA